MKNPISSTRRKTSNNSNIKKIATNFNENKNSFFAVYPNTTKSYKYINLNYQNRDLKKFKQSHNGLSNISYGQPHSLLVSHHTQRDSSSTFNNAKFILNNIKDNEVKTDYKADQGENSIVLSDQNYKEIIKSKEQEIEQLKSELNKAKEQLIESKAKLSYFNRGKDQSPFDLEYHVDKANIMSRTNDIQDYCQYVPSQAMNHNTQASIDHLIINSEQLIKQEENRMKNMASVTSKCVINMTTDLSEVKIALGHLKARTQRLLEHKNK